MKSAQLIGVLATLAAIGTFQSGCVAHAHAEATGTIDADAPVVFVGTPTLVAVDSGVWVVEDSERATYYVDEYYWVYRDGTWYRSPAYDSGWRIVGFHVVPGVISSRTHKLYVHYHDRMALTQPAPKHGERMNVADARNAHGDPPGHDDIPGVGNQRKAAGEQPGHPTHTKDDAKDDKKK